MPDTIHLVRHAQGFHNLSVENEALPDPLLTDLGLKQCANVRATFPAHASLTHLVASPMRRTLHTCLNSFGPTPEDLKPAALLPVIAIPELQEVSNSPCDTGTDVAVVAPEFGAKADFSRVPAGWNDKESASSPWEPTLDKLEARATKARLLLRDLARESGKEDVHIAAVSHGAAESYGVGKLRVPLVPSWTRRSKEARPTGEQLEELRQTFYREFGPLLKHQY
ncbi:phosphatase SPAC5H10.03 like protein [Verticillium longisporum]|uniref:Phosphatase SPAC5H10.03 like protein n=1 Tax=Verticillium longisporum TaxID=100787 RepID=A0A8I2ZUC0_VERLO|nr:phosphatase SPAC5H10.03 like protein [Verticillium longisporum]